MGGTATDGTAAAPRIAASAIGLIVFDFDGVLTDNRVWVFSDGMEAVACNRSDGLGFDFLRRGGMPAVIVSTERNPVVKARADKLKIPAMQDVADKKVAVEQLCRDRALALSRVVYVGNDLNDLPAMRIVGYPIAVGDAHPAVSAIAHRVLRTMGGAGVVRELIEEVIAFDVGMEESY